MLPWHTMAVLPRHLAKASDAPIENVAFTATHAGHRSGFLVFTTQRTYVLDLQSVHKTKVRLITWSVPLPPSAPSAPTSPDAAPQCDGPPAIPCGV